MFYTKIKRFRGRRLVIAYNLYLVNHSFLNYFTLTIFDKYYEEIYVRNNNFV